MIKSRVILFQDSRGFTLVELLMVMMLISIITSLGVFALRNYWMVQSLHGGRAEAVSRLRNSQELAVTENTPLVFGVRFRVGSSDWDLVRYSGSAGTCVVEKPQTFPAGVVVSAVTFAEASGITSTCRSALPGATSDEFAFFFPRGTATGGTVTLRQPALDRTLSISVSPMTGRVEEI